MNGVDRVDVLRIITRLNIGGPARHVLLLTEGLPRAGLSTHLLFGCEAPREGRIEPSQPVAATLVPSLQRSIRPLRDLRAYRALRNEMESRRPSIVHTHTAKAGTLGRIAARRAGVPIVVHTFHGHVLDEYFSGPVSATFAAAERTLARKTDVLIAVSEDVRDSLLERGIGTRDQWRVVPLGLDLSKLAGSLPERSVARTRLGLPGHNPLVGIVGRLTPVKNHQAFLTMAARVLKERPDTRFVIAGDGELRAKLERDAAAELGDAALFTGWVSDLPSLYSALDVVALTSLNEGTPVALIEAGAAGKPVVATRVGGVPSVVREGSTGWMFPTNDKDGPAGKIVELLDDVILRDKIGSAGRAWTTERFSADRLVSDLVQLYEELLKRSP